MEDKSLIKIKDFTLVELLVAISTIGFVMVALAVIFNIVRMNDRDAVRAENIATINRALALYFKDSRTGYPPSTGECLDNGSGVGGDLVDAGALLYVPMDPLWPAAPPVQTGGAPNADQANFCYFYYSDAADQYEISYFLESNSNSGPAGINTMILP